MDVNNVIRAALVAALSCTLSIPTASIAAPIGTGLALSDGVTIENVAMHGRHGKRGRGGHGHGGWHGGYGHGGGHGHGHGGWHGGHGGWHGGHGHGHGGHHHGGGNHWHGWYPGFGFGSGFNDDDNYYYFDTPRYGGGHIARCEAAYRTYDPRTDRYLGYDGAWHRCRL